MCLLDQSAAYDLLCHQTLKKKLELYNFSEGSIEWLMSYLGGRTQMVQVESKTSTPLFGGDHAVPQGSVLGGLLHVINSNDFPDCHQEGDSVVYVDDDSDTVSGRNPADVRNSIEREAGNSAQWLKDNRLCVAGSKSKFLMIGTSQLRKSKINKEFKIVVDNQEITETSSEKVLGVVVNNVLTWKNHIYGDVENEGLIQQLSKRLGMLKLMSKYMRKENLKYFADECSTPNSSIVYLYLVMLLVWRSIKKKTHGTKVLQQRTTRSYKCYKTNYVDFSSMLDMTHLQKLY